MSHVRRCVVVEMAAQPDHVALGLRLPGTYRNEERGMRCREELCGRLPRLKRRANLIEFLHKS